MKKYLKGNLKRWIAFLLAVVLIVTTCVYSSDAFLRANDEGDTPNQTETASGEQEIEPVDVGDQNESDEEEGSEDPDGSDEEEGSGDQEEPEVEEGSEDPEGDLEDGEVTDEDAVTDPVENPEEAPKSPEEEVSVAYSYAIYYYYDGVEDVNARVEKEDGVLGEKILASVNVEEEVTFNGKNYKLDKIENKDGEIAEDGNNTVKVYYESVEDEKPVEEEKKEYSLEFVEPSEGATVSVVSVDGEEGEEENTYKEDTKVTFEVNVDEGYGAPSVQDQNNNVLKAESTDEEGGEYTYTVTMTEDMVVTISCAVAFGLRPLSEDTRDGEPTTYTIIYMYAPYGSVLSGHKIGSITINGNVGDLVSGRDASNEYPTVTDGEYVYTTKGGSFILGDDAKKYEESPNGHPEEVGIELVDNPDKNIIYVVYSTREPVTKVVSINFVANEGIPVDSMKGESGIPILNREMPVTTREGYKFAGWYDNAELEGKEVTELPMVYPDNDITYYAKWTEKNATYKIQHYQEQVDGTFELVDEATEEGEVGSVVSAWPEEYEDFVYDSSVKETVDGGKILADGSLVLKLFYVRKSATVTYILNGGTVEDYGNGEYDEAKGEIVFSVKIGDDTPTIPDPVKTGYKFDRWDEKIEEKVSKPETIYRAIYSRSTADFTAKSYEGIYDTAQHQVDVSGISLVNGESIEYYYNRTWLDADEMERNWPKNVTDSFEVGVRVVDEKQNVIWETEEGEYPYVKITPREVEIGVPNAEKEYSRSNDYTFDKEQNEITYTYGNLSSDELDEEIRKELSFINKLDIKRTEENEKINKVGVYVDALELNVSEDELSALYPNFSFIIVKGTLTIKTKEDINALSVELTSDTGSDGITYDGGMHFVTFEVTIDGEKYSKEEAEAQGVVFSYSTGDGYISESQRDVVNKFVEVIAARDGYQSATSNKVIVRINPKEVQVTANDATTVLAEGAEIIYSENPITVEGLVSDDAIGANGESADDVFSYKLVEGNTSWSSVGKIEGAITLTYNKDDINPNYSVKVVPGELDVQGTVTYNANDLVLGKLEGSLPSDTTTYSFGGSITVQIPDKYSFKKDGATFLGWTNGGSPVSLVQSKDEIPGGMLTSDNAALTMGHQNITLYAVWAKDTNNDNIPDYEQNQVIYDLNGGEATPKPVDEKYYNVGETATLISYGSEEGGKPTKDEAVFVGWSTDPSVKGQSYESNPTGFVVDKVTFAEASDITVYAVWAKDTNGPEGSSDGIADYLEHKVTYKDLRFGVIPLDDSNLYPKDYPVTLKDRLSAPDKKQEYELILFDSWKNDQIEISTDESGKSTFIMPDREVEFVAQWKYLTIEKEVVEKEDGYKVGEDMLFTITVENKGDVDVTGIIVREVLAGAKLMNGDALVDEMTFDLREGQSKVLEARYEVKDTDVKEKSLTNTVKAVVGNDEATATVIGTNSLAGIDAKLHVSKTIKDQQASYQVGDTITFNVTVENIGSVTVKDITVTDVFEEAKVESASFFARVANVVRGLFTGWEAGSTSDSFDLKPGEKKELTVKYTVDENDLGHSGIWNVATARGESAIDGSIVTGSNHSDKITFADPEQKISLQKEVVTPDNGLLVDGKYPVGSTVTYQVTVKNEGNVSLNDFIINDQLTDENGDPIVVPDGAISAISVEGETETTVEWIGNGFTIGTLGRNETLVFTYTYKVQEEDAGKTINNAVVPGNGIEGDEDSSEPITVVEKGLEVKKIVTSTPAGNDGKYAFHEEVEYEVTVTNTGNVSLSNIRVDDQFKDLGYGASLIEGESNIIETLGANESKTLHYTYQIEEKDLGKTIANIATATAVDRTEGKNPEDQAVIETVDPEQKAKIEKHIVSIESNDTVTDYQDGNMVKVGDTITYEIVVTNVGNTTLENISISDQMNGRGTIEVVSGASYNSGIFTINEKIEQQKSKTVTYKYKVVEADKGLTITNTAQIEGEIKDEDGNTPEDEKEVTVENKSLEVTKEIDGEVPENGYNTGETVQFKVIVKNTGNVDLSGIKVEDTMAGELDSEGNSPEAIFVPTDEMPTQTIDSLKVGESKTLIYQYTVRSVDVDSKTTPTNTATVTPENDLSVVPSEPVVIPIRNQEPAYEIEKKLHDAINGIFSGESIAYDIEITNTGNTTLSKVAIRDVMSYVGTDETGIPEGTITVTSGNADWENGYFVLRDPLAWGGNKVIVRYTYTVTADDAGKTISNTAYDSDDKPSTSEDVTIEKKSIDVTKVAKTKKDQYALGEVIEFEIVVENTGNVELSNIVVDDQMQSAAAEAVYVSCKGAEFNDGKISNLAPNDKATLTYQYTIIENDLGNSLGNEVKAYVEAEPDINGSGVVGGLHAAEPKSSVSLEKTITGNGTGADGKYKVGDTINYQIVVTNTGNTTLDNVIVKDVMTEASSKINATSVKNADIVSAVQTDNGWEYELKLKQSVLPIDPSKPEQNNTVTISYTYTVRKDDVGNQIGNIAVVDDDNVIIDDSENPDPILVEKRELEVTKKVVNAPEDGKAYKLGETIRFEVVVKNVGNVALNNITVTDIMVGIDENAVVGTGGNTQSIQRLEAGESRTLGYFTYTVNEKALKAPGDADAIKNTVTAVADDGTEGYDETDYLKIGEQNPDFTVAKEVTSTGSAEGGRYAIGEAIQYRIVVTNIGNVTLRNIVVKDTMTGATGDISNVEGATWNERMGSFIINDPITVGGAAEITYDYVVQPDDAGREIINVATGKPLNPSSETKTEIENRKIEVSKQLTSSPMDPERGYVAGERITFDVRLENTGNVALSDISIVDEMQNAVGVADLVDENGNLLNDGSDKNISLAVGENKVFHYSYTVQRGDEGAESDIISGGKTIFNKAKVEINDGKSLDGKLEDTSNEALIDGLHTLTVYYQYADGRTAAVTLRQDFAYGDSFAFTIPEIAGYTATLGGVSVQGAVMFVSSMYDEKDPVFTVIYNSVPVEEPAGTPVPDPDGGEPVPAPDDEDPVPVDDVPVPPAPPVDEEPIPEAVIVPVTPAAVAAPGILGGGAGLVAIGDTPVPLDGVITQDDDGNVVIVPVEDVEVPLANREVDDHKCCILSFLLMLATLIIYSWFTHSMKKRQKKLAELKDQLAEETLKRQLGITDESIRRR